MINRSVSVSVSAPPSGPAFWAADGVPASQRRTSSVVIRGGRKVCDHAARAPAASIRAGAADPERASRGVPGSVIVRSAPCCRSAAPAQLRTRHSRWGALSACSGRALVSVAVAATATDTVSDTDTDTDTGTATAAASVTVTVTETGAGTRTETSMAIDRRP